MDTNMSIQTIHADTGFTPVAKAAHGGDGGFTSKLSTLIDALATACRAEAEYRRQIARGVSPAVAASKAFQTSFKG